MLSVVLTKGKKDKMNQEKFKEFIKRLKERCCEYADNSHCEDCYYCNQINKLVEEFAQE